MKKKTYSRIIVFLMALCLMLVTVGCGKEKEPPDVSEADDCIGTKVSFTTTDLDGNPISSEEIFSQHEITMVNIWSSWLRRNNT